MSDLTDAIGAVCRLVITDPGADAVAHELGEVVERQPEALEVRPRGEHFASTNKGTALFWASALARAALRYPRQGVVGGRLAIDGFEVEALKVRGRLDVHRRRNGRLQDPAGVATGLEGASQDVVGVGRHNDTADR